MCFRFFPGCTDPLLASTEVNVTRSPVSRVTVTDVAPAAAERFGTEFIDDSAGLAHPGCPTPSTNPAAMTPLTILLDNCNANLPIDVDHNVKL